MVETQVEKFTKLRDGLIDIESGLKRRSRAGQFLGVGAVTELVELQGTRTIGTYLSATSSGIQIQYTENGRLADVEEVYKLRDDQVVVDRSHSALESGLSLPNMRRTVEFGRIGLSFLPASEPRDELGSGKAIPVSWDQVKYLDELARHFVSQATTMRIGASDEIMTTSHRGIRLPVKDFNKSLPGHGNIPLFLLRHQSITAPDTRLDSGLPFHFFITSGGEYEGHGMGLIIGDFSKFINPSEYPSGPLFRPHSACCRSEGFEPYELDKAYNLEELKATFEYRGVQDGSGHLRRGLRDPQCDCYLQLEYSQARIATEGGIYVDLMEQEGRGYGLLNKEEMLRLSKWKNVSTPELCEQYGVMDDMRVYDRNAEALYEGGIRYLQIIGNNPRKVAAYKRAGIQVTSVPARFPRPENLDELKSKIYMGHDIPEDELLLRPSAPPSPM